MQLSVILLSFTCLSNVTFALQLVRPTYDKTDIVIPSKTARPNPVVPLKKFKSVQMDFDYKNIISYLYGLDKAKLLEDPTFPNRGLGKPNSSAISFLFKDSFKGNKILFQFTPDRIYFHDLNGERFDLFGVRQIPLSNDLTKFRYSENSAMSTQFFILKYLDVDNNAYKIELKSANNPNQMIKESIYADTYSLRNFSEQDNLVKISENKQAFVLHVKNSFYEPTKIKVKLLILNFDSDLEIIDLDTIADITEDIEFKPRAGQKIKNRLRYKDPYFYEEYLKIDTSKNEKNEFYDVQLEMQHQLFRPLNRGELPYKIIRTYVYNQNTKKYQKVSEEKVLDIPPKLERVN